MNASSTTYELSIRHLMEMFAKELGVRMDQIDVKHKMRCVGQHEELVFDGLIVSVDHNKRAPVDVRD